MSEPKKNARGQMRVHLVRGATYGDLAIRHWVNEGLTEGEHVLYAAPPDGSAALAKRIHEVMDEGDGCWVACSGCQESVDGYVSQSLYPYSETFKCQPGGGCSECGGLGAKWDDTDYEEAARYMLAHMDEDEAADADGERAQADRTVAREALAKMVEGMMEDPLFSRHPDARVALACAAQNIRRGRKLTEAEQLENLASATEAQDPQFAATLRRL